MRKKAKQKQSAKKAETAEHVQPVEDSRAVKAIGRGAWKTLDASSALLAATAAPLISQLLWRLATGRKAPQNTRNPELGTGEAIAWAAVGGATVQVIRTIIRRSATTYWVKSTGEMPPGLKAKKG